MNSVGIIGAGTMGLGIAQVCATAACDVYLFDLNPDQTLLALRSIDQNFSHMVSKRTMTDQQKSQAIKRIHSVSNLSKLKVDLIIEAAVERVEVKQELFLTLEKINDGKAVLSTNTSSLSVTQIASGLKDPSRLLGFHFFNPADKMKLVEIISGKDTDPGLVKTLIQFARRLGKTPVLAKDSPGFIVNRVARPYYVESLKVAEEEVADFSAVDKLLKSAGFKMGPFELMDLIGLDTNLAVTKSVYEGFHRPSKFRPSPIQEALVAAGNFGRKSGRGYYDYGKK